MRFASLIRVSTTGQEDTGESLRTQEKRNQQAVTLRGDVITMTYKGQEHATPQQDRKLLNELLEDAGKNIFDAVIVDDPSRWSRDNSRSKHDLDILRDNGIKFFSAGIEYNLFNPNSFSMLNLQTEMNEMFATVQAYKSIVNKVERAKRGIPTAGKLPFGRGFNKQTNQWFIDPEKQRIIDTVAEEYIKGTSIRLLAKRFGLNASNLHKNLLYRCGDTWVEAFESKRFGIKAEITHKIPRLLSDEMIRRVREATTAKRSYNIESPEGEYNAPGKSKRFFRRYLLSRMIFCGDCGLTCDACTNGGREFYRHSRARDKDQRCFGFIAAHRIEDAVLGDIFTWFGGGNVLDKETLETKVNQIEKERNKIKDRIDLYDKELQGINIKQDNLIKAIADGFYSAKLKDQQQGLEDREQEVKAERARLQEQLESFMTEGELKDQLERASSMTAQIQKRIKEGYLRSDHHKESMTFDEKRELLKAVFSGRDIDGKRLGVYLKKRGDQWSSEIRGQFKTIEGFLGDKDREGGSFLGNKQGMNSKGHPLTGCGI